MFDIRLSAAAGLLLVFAAPSANAAPDWSKVPKRDIQVFHAGVTPIEWATKKANHSGSVGLRKGESCAGCHEEKGALNFDMKRLADKELEPVGAPKTMSFPVGVQAAYDKDHLYLRVSFKPPADAAAAAPREDKDPKHDVKVAVMFLNGKVPEADKVGCWATCHADARSMPDAKPDKKKYVTGANLAGGVFADYIQWKSGAGGKGALFLDGHVAAERVNKDGKALVKAEGENKGGAYTVTFTRKLTGGEGDVAMGEGQVIPFGIAIHTDKTVYRFHHVSLGYTLGLGAKADVVAAKN
ncbi:MAG: hypothetical protein JNK75_09125 [Betaproteobacteria bacterium]|nr:hypothetical protein [Betaproteobacteria bacterium]